MPLPYGNYRYYVIGQRGQDSLKAALLKLDHFNFNHAVVPADDDLVWCKKCGAFYHA